jgi:hypothetical protein
MIFVSNLENQRPCVDDGEETDTVGRYEYVEGKAGLRRPHSVESAAVRPSQAKTLE